MGERQVCADCAGGVHRRCVTECDCKSHQHIETWEPYVVHHDDDKPDDPAG